MISEDCFFVVLGSSLICWDFKAHKQYQLSVAHARRLIFLIYNQDCIDQNCMVDQELIRAGVVKITQEQTDYWGWDVLSRIFHFGTKNIPLDDIPQSEEAWAKLYLEHCDGAWARPLPIDYAHVGGEAGILLPRKTCEGQLEQSLYRRSTTREFIDVPLRLEMLAKILQFTLGFVDDREVPVTSGLPDSLRKRRCSPSGGGLNSTEGYVLVRNVEGLDEGIYYYDAASHRLLLKSTDVPSVGQMLSGQHFANNLPAGVFFTSRFDKLWWKYEHSRAYRNALLEVGHVAQTFQIISTSLGLGTWLTGALCEQDIEPFLKLENAHEQVLFFVGCGYTSGEATPESLRMLTC
ncbi:SagB family peptide dehydrogenase [Pseudomonas sp.]|uniref:SagB family peptide dehydrogenase n=1 Tax=Pseudomonas sp. TaxID=306 RepID=UPI0028B06FD5|nr:SagB family peptide dehydrogenase [Pseudomonas sp.]